MRNLKLKRVSSLIALTLILSGCALLSSCLKSPGVDEPQIAICSIISPEKLDCVYPDVPGSEFQIGIIDAIGFQAVRPKGFSALISHHEILHRELNRCSERK